MDRLMPTYRLDASQRAELEQVQRELNELLTSHPGVRATVSVAAYGMRPWGVEVYRGDRCIASADRDEPGGFRDVVEKALASQPPHAEETD